jgi:hypothetical protein
MWVWIVTWTLVFSTIHFGTTTEHFQKKFTDRTEVDSWYEYIEYENVKGNVYDIKLDSIFMYSIDTSVTRVENEPKKKEPFFDFNGMVNEFKSQPRKQTLKEFFDDVANKKEVKE